MDVVKKTLKYTGVFLILFLLIVFLQKPSNDREWSLEQSVLPRIEVDGNILRVFSVRDFRYGFGSELTGDPSSIVPVSREYDDREYDLESVISLDYIVVPFTDQIGAHTMLSFGFEDGRYLAVSVEIRKETGESFSALRGLFNQFEIMYVVADERDVIDLRAQYRKDEIFLYPVKSDQEGRKKILLDMMARAQGLYEEPEFYNTAFNNCTTSIVGHANQVYQEPISWDWSFVLPEHSDQLAYRLGLLDVPQGLTIEVLREQYTISERAKSLEPDEFYSKNLRKRD